MEIQGLLWVYVFPLSFTNFDSLFLWLSLIGQKDTIIKQQNVWQHIQTNNINILIWPFVPTHLQYSFYMCQCIMCHQKCICKYDRNTMTINIFI